MHLVDDDGMPLNGTATATLTAVHRSHPGRPERSARRAAGQEQAYDQVLDLLLARLGMLDARLMDALSTHVTPDGWAYRKQSSASSVPIPLALSLT